MKMHYVISKTIYTIYQIYKYATFSNLHSQHLSFNSDQPSPKFAYLSNLQYHLQWPTHIIYFINYETNTPNSPYTVTDCPNGLQKFSKNSNNSVPSFGTDQTAVQGLKTNRNITKHLKKSVTSSRIKPLPHGVCRNSNFLVSTRSSRCVDQLFLQSQRKPTVRFS